jgi:hypothetical protein
MVSRDTIFVIMDIIADTIDTITRHHSIILLTLFFLRTNEEAEPMVSSGAAATADSMVLSMIERSEHLDKWRP